MFSALEVQSFNHWTTKKITSPGWEGWQCWSDIYGLGWKPRIPGLNLSLHSPKRQNGALAFVCLYLGRKPKLQDTLADLQILPPCSQKTAHLRSPSESYNSSTNDKKEWLILEGDHYIPITCYTSCHFIFIASIWESYYHHPYSSDGETNVWSHYRIQEPLFESNLIWLQSPCLELLTVLPMCHMLSRQHC